MKLLTYIKITQQQQQKKNQQTKRKITKNKKAMCSKPEMIILQRCESFTMGDRPPPGVGGYSSTLGLRGCATGKALFYLYVPVGET